MEMAITGKYHTYTCHKSEMLTATYWYW